MKKTIIKLLYNYFFAVFFLLVISFFGICAVLSGTAKEIAKGGVEAYKNQDFSVLIDAIKTSYADLTISDKPLKPFEKISPLNRYNIIDINGGIAALMGQRVVNSVVKLNNGHLAMIDPKISDEDLLTTANSFRDLQVHLSETNTPILYIQTPSMSSKYDPQLPKGVEEWNNDNIDRLLSYMTDYNVPFIDMREEFKNDGMDQYDYFYYTDIHWTSEAGFYTYKKLVSYMERLWGMEFNSPAEKIENYGIKNYPLSFFGAFTRRAGLSFADKVDDMHIIYPTFPTLFLRESDNSIGSYNELLIDEYFLQTPESNLSDRYIYTEVYGKSVGHHYVNKSEYNVIEKRILVVTDSMGMAVCPFLIATFKDVYASYYKASIELIDEYEPDLVIYITHPVNIGKLPYFKS